MPGSSESEAIQNYSDPIIETLGCVTSASLVHAPIGRFDALIFDVDRGIASVNGTSFGLYFAQTFSVIRGSSGWKVRTEAYVYKLLASGTHPHIQYHWHPDGDYLKKRPHIHFNARSGVLKRSVSKYHFPTGRMSIEELIRFLIEEEQATPTRSDWSEVLQRNLECFEAYRTWA